VDERGLAAVARSIVGVVPLRKALRIVRQEMVARAMEITKGNKSRAAEALSVTRQALQQIVGRR
jgi:DNA-binding protein Fis